MSEKEAKKHSKAGNIDDKLRRMPTFKIFLYVAMMGMTALFLPLVVYYFVMTAPQTFPIPNIFTINSFLLILSSLLLERSYYCFKQDQFIRFRIYLGNTLLLGILFLIGQYYGWLKLKELGVALSGAPNGSIFYIISGFHALHLAGGLLFLVVVFVDALKQLTYLETFINYINPSKQIRLQLLRIYWHFLDILWVLLFTCFLI